MTLSVGFRQPSLAAVLEHLSQDDSTPLVVDIRNAPPGFAPDNVDALRQQLMNWIEQRSDTELRQAGDWPPRNGAIATAMPRAISCVLRPAFERARSVKIKRRSWERSFTSPPPHSSPLQSRARYESTRRGHARKLAEFHAAGWLEDAPRIWRPMISIESGDWDRLETPACAVRTAVFVHEQAVAPEEEWDVMDAQCLHFVARDRTGNAVGTARLTRRTHRAHGGAQSLLGLAHWRRLAIGCIEAGKSRTSAACAQCSTDRLKFLRPSRFYCAW